MANTKEKHPLLKVFYRLTEVRRLLGVGAVIVFVVMSLTCKWEPTVSKDLCLMIISYYVGAKTAISAAKTDDDEE